MAEYERRVGNMVDWFEKHNRLPGIIRVLLLRIMTVFDIEYSNEVINWENKCTK